MKSKKTDEKNCINSDVNVCKCGTASTRTKMAH